MEDKKKILYSAMQATGNLTLGNYLGALKNWVKLSEEYECYFTIADLHSLTVRQNPADFRRHARELLMIFLAAGIDPEKSCLFLQHHVPAHSELSWLLNCFTYMGEMNRMTQFKDKSAKHADNINTGLFTYPVLMAADILLYQADLVPVGIDQKQHLEIARTIAERINKIYPDIFTVPEGYYAKIGAKVMSLQEPGKKMSKSDENGNGSIYLLDDADTVLRKVKRAVTDSEARIAYREEQPGVRNLIDIYCACTGALPDAVVADFEGRGYGDLKLAVAEAVNSILSPLQARVRELEKDKAYVDSVMKQGAERAAWAANRTLRKFQKKLGLVELPR